MGNRGSRKISYGDNARRRFLRFYDGGGIVKWVTWVDKCGERLEEVQGDNDCGGQGIFLSDASIVGFFVFSFCGKITNMKREDVGMCLGSSILKNNNNQSKVMNTYLKF